jgi:hypothetical protein
MEENQVRERLRQLLPQLDLETATQRTIQERLEDELGMSLENHKSLLKAEIDAFLMEADCDKIGEADDKQLTAQSPPSKKRKTADLESEPASDLPSGFHICRPISSSSSKRFAGVRSYKNATLVDVREFYRNEHNGQLAPGQKGLSMSVSQWQALVTKQRDITDAINRGDDSFYVELGSNRRAAVTLLGGKVMIQLREYYEKSNTMLPGKKGIALPPDQWNALCDAIPSFNSYLPEPQSTLGGALPRQNAEPQTPGNVVASVDISKGPSELFSVNISDDPVRRIQATRWKGRLTVDIREFYKKSSDGELAHSKKGLSVSLEQFKTLQSAAASVTRAFEREDTSFEVKLSDV